MNSYRSTTNRMLHFLPNWGRNGYDCEQVNSPFSTEMRERRREGIYRCASRTINTVHFKDGHVLLEHSFYPSSPLPLHPPHFLMHSTALTLKETAAREDVQVSGSYGKCPHALQMGFNEVVGDEAALANKPFYALPVLGSSHERSSDI